jgi:hypothetical protein
MKELKVLDEDSIDPNCYCIMTNANFNLKVNIIYQYIMQECTLLEIILYFFKFKYVNSVV